MIVKKPLKFEFIYEDLKERILMNEFEDSDKLPPENILTETYNCSRPTLQKALRMLIRDNLVSTIQGSGTFINKEPKPEEKQEEAEVPPLQGQSLYGLIFPNLGPGFIFKTITDSIAEMISHMNASLVWGGFISPTASNLRQQIKNICQNYIDLGMKGVFFSPFEYTDYAREANEYIVDTLSGAGIPIVLVDADVAQFPNRSAFDLVSLDHLHAGYTIASHMLEKGLKKLIFINLPYSKDSWKYRKMGFYEAMHDHGITPEAAWFLEGKPEHLEEVKKIIQEHKPDGIVTLIDRAAVSLISSLKQLGIRVPQDILVGSFDDLGYLFDMSISTIRQPLEEIGKAAVRVMLEREAYPNALPQSIILRGELIKGISTDPKAEESL